MGQHNRPGKASSATAERRQRSLGHTVLPNEYAHRMVHLCPELIAKLILFNASDPINR